MTKVQEPSDRFVVEWLAEGPDRGPEAVLDRALGSARRARQRPGWSLPSWWLPGAFSGPLQLRVALAVVVALLVATAMTLVWIGSPRPPLRSIDEPPGVLTVWLVIENGRSTDVVFEVTGGTLTYADSVDDHTIGITATCSIDVLPFTMAMPWSIEVDGLPVLSSVAGRETAVGLPLHGAVTLRVVASEDAGLVVDQPVSGEALDHGGTKPESCGSFGEPIAEGEVPEPLQDSWRAQVDGAGSLPSGKYDVIFDLALALLLSPRGGATAYSVHGGITLVSEHEITFGGTPACPSPGDYRWVVSDSESVLTFISVDDTCEARRALLLSGPMTRYPGLSLRPGVRYVVPDFDPAIAMTVPRDLHRPLVAHPNQYSERNSEDLYYFLPGLGWQLTTTPDVVPAVCSGVSRSLTGLDAIVEPPERPLLTLEAFRSAFSTWDASHQGATISESRSLVIDGQAAVAIDVLATEACPIWSFMPSRGILERFIAIDVGDEVRIVAMGPTLYLMWGERDAPHVYDVALYDLGERLATSIELLP